MKVENISDKVLSLQIAELRQPKNVLGIEKRWAKIQEIECLEMRFTIKILVNNQEFSIIRFREEVDCKNQSEFYPEQSHMVDNNPIQVQHIKD